MEDHLKQLEDARWYLGKGQLMDKHLQESAQVLGAAGRARFDAIPGHTRYLERRVEIQTKNELTNLNYEVAQEALDRFLALARAEADKEISEALQLVETEKAQLLADLENEFAQTRAAKDDRLEELAQLMVHQDIRALAILQAKTAHEIAMQQIKREIVNSERTTFDAEQAVLAKKLEVAQVKLAMIPEIKATLDAQRKVLEAEEGLIPLYQEKADAEKNLLGVLEETIPLLHDKAAVTKELAEKIRELIPIHRQLKEYDVSIELARGAAQDESIAQQWSDFTDEQQRDLLQDIENETRKQRLALDTELSRVSADTAEQLRREREKTAEDETYTLRVTGENRLEAASQLTDYQVSRLPRAAEDEARLREKEIKETADIRAKEKREKADLTANTKVTAKLLHAIS